jgi:hypothetical protein
VIYAADPVTDTVGVMVARPVKVLHVPPARLLCTVIVSPSQIVVLPAIGATNGVVFTVTTLTAVCMPQEFDTEYDIGTSPPVTPVTTPALFTVPIDGFPVDHIPPAIAPDNVVVAYWHTIGVPDIGAGVGADSTETMNVV